MRADKLEEHLHEERREVGGCVIIYIEAGKKRNSMNINSA